MAAPHSRKKMPPQKRMKPKQKTKRQQQPPKKQQQRNRTMKQAKDPSKDFVPKMLQGLCEGKTPLLTKGNGNAIFSQRCVLTTQDGQQQYFLSNYMSSQATTGSTSTVPPAIGWPHKPGVTKWPVTLSPQPQRTLCSPMWQDGGQQRCILSHAVPSVSSGGRMGNQVDVLIAKDIQYEVNEIVPRQMVPYLFTSDPNVSPY